MPSRLVSGEIYCTSIFGCVGLGAGVCFVILARMTSFDGLLFCLRPDDCGLFSCLDILLTSLNSFGILQAFLSLVETEGGKGCFLILIMC